MKGYYQLITKIFQEKKITIIDQNPLVRLINEYISELKEREQNVVRMRFGLEDGSGKTLQQIGNVLGVTRERIRQIERKALRRLKHPTRAKKLLQYLEVTECLA